MIDQLMAALADEFDLDVVFYPARPSSLTAPSVVVTPGEPFQEPNTQGLILERWEVWAAASTKEPDRGTKTMRELSLRIARCVQKVGAVWRETTGPRAVRDPQAAEVIAIVKLDFKYPPDQVIGAP